MSELSRRVIAPFLPTDARYRLRQQRLDAEVTWLTRRVFSYENVSATVLRSASSRERSPEAMTVVPIGPRHLYPGWFDNGRIGWDGTSLFAVGDHGASATWRPQRGGIERYFRAENVSRARRRPAPSGECPNTVAEIAGVALRGHAIRRLYFLDRESHHLAALPMMGLSEPDVAALAARAGIHFRVYSLTNGNPLVPLGTVPPDEMCEVLFPRSARRRKLLSRVGGVTDWLTRT
jgi:hypothetical protein